MYIDPAGARWFKGNLHTHTTNSDGRMDPSDCAALYRARGYDFLSLTDHWKISETRTHESGILLLSGTEYDFGRSAAEGIFHIVAVGYREDPGIVRGRDTPQSCIDKIHAAGGLASLAHPAWSLNTLDQLLPLGGVDYTEIFNSTSDLPHNCRPYSGETVDLLAARGVFWKTAAVDDAHWYDGDECRSFVYVRAEECTEEAILRAMRAGAFYSSQGPRLSVRWDREAGTVTADCPEEDGVRRLVYFTDAAWTNHRSDTAEPGKSLTRGEFALTGRETFVRVEAVDAAGRYAWAQTVKVK